MRGSSAGALWGYAGSGLRWLELNMRRSIGGPPFGGAEQELGLHETAQALAALHSLTANLPAWAQWIDEGRRKGSRAQLQT